MMKKMQRPVLQLPLTNCEKIFEILSIIGVILNLILPIAMWDTLPERIPTHFGASGIPDSWGGKGSLAFLPIGVILMYMLLSVVSRYPHTFNYPWRITEENAKVQYLNARKLIVFLKTEIIWSFTYIQWMTIQVALGKSSGLGNMFLCICLLIIFGTIGVYFYKARKHK